MKKINISHQYLRTTPKVSERLHIIAECSMPFAKLINHLNLYCWLQFKKHRSKMLYIAKTRAIGTIW